MTDQFFQLSESEREIATRAYITHLNYVDFEKLCEKIMQLDFSNEEEFRRAMFDYMIYTGGKNSRLRVGYDRNYSSEHPDTVTQKMQEFVSLISLFDFQFSAFSKSVGEKIVKEYRLRKFGELG